MERKTLFRTIIIGVKAITIGEKDWVQVQKQQGQVEIYNQQAE